MRRSTLHAAIAIAALCFAFPASGQSDVPRPKNTNEKVVQPDKPKEKENTLRVVIESEDSAREAQLWLPPSMLASIDRGGATAGTTASGLPPVQTIVAGLALSLSLVLGGLWLVRTRHKIGTRAATSAAVVLATLAGTAAFALANLGPPRNYKPVDPGTLRLAAPNGEPLAGTARYYYGEEGVIRIVLPKEK